MVSTKNGSTKTTAQRRSIAPATLGSGAKASPTTLAQITDAFAAIFDTC
jgi:hypothetical protein